MVPASNPPVDPPEPEELPRVPDDEATDAEDDPAVIDVEVDVEEEEEDEDELEPTEPVVEELVDVLAAEVPEVDEGGPEVVEVVPTDVLPEGVGALQAAAPDARAATIDRIFNDSRERFMAHQVP